jgi:phage shock protein PspC (stress-responsive transcriptional regulator)
MKKSISVNISGLLFNIEEDAYERLKRYLDEVKLYFVSYDASGEIVADIESRIAEIFSTKVGPHKQMLTLADVEAIIAQMGNIQDFAAIEEPLEEPRAASSRPYGTYTSYDAETTPEGEAAKGARKLYRDESRKMIGGVAAGFANYLRLDPTWVRLALVGFVAFDIFITLAISSSALIIAYIAMWIVLPARTDLVQREDKKSKKLYRNPDDKVIGGVAGGLGAFFGIDTVLIRILFVVFFIVGGSGLVMYIILWICMPMATTLTQRMQIKGEPVTLANIEHQVKKNLDVKEGEEESLLVRILLFPFRLLSVIFSKGSAGARVLVQFIGDVVRVVVGFVLSTTGFFTLLAILIALGVYLGLDPDRYIHLARLDAPLALLKNTVPTYLVIAVALVAAIPVLYVMLLGIALLSRRWLMPSSGSWIMAGLWIMAIIATAGMVPRYIFDYNTLDFIDREARIFKADSSKTLVLRMEQGNWKNLYNVDLNIKGSPDGSLRLEQRVLAHGADSDEAQEHASWATYDVKQQGSIILFSNHLTLPEDKPYYLQHVNATLYVPYGQPFKVDYTMKEMLRGSILSPWGYHARDIKSNTFVFDKTGEITCLTCSEERMEEVRESQQFKAATNGGRVLNYKDFDKLSVGSHYQLTLVQGPEYKVEVSGDEEALDAMNIRQRGSSLSFLSEKWTKNWWSLKNKKPAHIYVSVPSLAGLYLSGATRAHVKLQQEKSLALELSGAAEMEGDLEVEDLQIDMSGSSELSLAGICKKLRASLSGASQLIASKFRSDKAYVDLSGASEADVWANDLISGGLSGGSELQYKGQPQVSVNTSAGASIRQHAE